MKQESPVQDEERVITDEMLASARSRIGALMKVHVPFNEFVTVDAMRHFAHGTGDDNPMYCDRNYGAKTRWGNMIAPPLFYRSTGNPSLETGARKTVSGPGTPSVASTPGTWARPSIGSGPSIPATSYSPTVFARISSKSEAPSPAAEPSLK